MCGEVVLCPVGPQIRLSLVNDQILKRTFHLHRLSNSGIRAATHLYVIMLKHEGAFSFWFFFCIVSNEVGCD